jgi:hypothetical protein
MKFNFDTIPDTSVSFIDHNRRETTRFGSSISMSAIGNADSAIQMDFDLRDQVRPEYVSSEPTGRRVSVHIQLDSKQASLLASWIIRHVNNDEYKNLKLDFEDSHGEPIKLPIEVDV